MEELSSAVHERGTRLNRRVYAIAESELNNTRLIRPQELGGYGLDAQWNDDFHHSLRTAFTHEKAGYYADFDGVPDLEKAFRQGFTGVGIESRQACQQVRFMADRRRIADLSLGSE